MRARCVSLLFCALALASPALAQPATKRGTFEDIVERIARPDLSATIVDHFARREKPRWFGPRLRLAIAIDRAVLDRNATCLRQIEALYQATGEVAGFGVPVSIHPLSTVRTDASGALVLFADDAADVVLVISPRDRQAVDLDAPPPTGGAPLFSRLLDLSEMADTPTDTPIRSGDQRYFAKTILARATISVSADAVREVRARDGLCAYKPAFFQAFFESITTVPALGLTADLYRGLEGVEPSDQRRMRAAFLLALLAVYREPERASRTPASRFNDYTRALANTREKFMVALDR